MTEKFCHAERHTHPTETCQTLYVMEVHSGEYPSGQKALSAGLTRISV
ncbi:MAG: hypothetical protein ACR2PT_19455 [Endozoicomonas sp.]